MATTALPLAMPEAARPLLPLALWHDLLGLLFVALTLLVACKLAIPRPALPATTLPVADCDLQRETCRLHVPGSGMLELDIAGRIIRPEQPFVVEAVTDRSDVRLLEMVIHGMELEMSSVPFRFQDNGDRAYRVEASLPVCTVRSMTWQMNVLIETDGRRLQWPLRFRTTSEGEDIPQVRAPSSV